MTHDRPIVRIYRGVAGAGKTMTVAQWRKAFSSLNVRVFSADHYRVDPVTGAYIFDAKNPGKAHTECFCDYLWCLAGQDLARKTGGDPRLDYVVVDNTNTRAYEIAPYVQAASAYGLPHEIITVLCDPAVAAARNVHGVPATTVWAMHRAILTEHLPPFWNHAHIINGG